jgi:hypothetical protein
MRIARETIREEQNKIAAPQALQIQLHGSLMLNAPAPAGHFT